MSFNKIKNTLIFALLVWWLLPLAAQNDAASADETNQSDSSGPQTNLSADENQRREQEFSRFLDNLEKENNETKKPAASESQIKENPFFKYEQFQRTIKGEDQSQLDPMARQTLDSQANINAPSGRFVKEHSGWTNRGDNMRPSGLARRAHLTSGFGMYNTFMASLMLSKSELLRPLASDDNQPDNLKGRSAQQEEQRLQRAYINYFVNWNFFNRQSLSDPSSHAENSSQLLNDFQFSTLIQSTANWQQRFQTHIFQSRMDLQANPVLSQAYRQRADLEWINNIRQNKAKYYILSGYRNSMHEFENAANNSPLQAVRHDGYIHANAEFELGDTHKLTTQLQLNFFQAESELPTNLDNGFAFNGLMQDSVSRMEAGLLVYDSWRFAGAGDNKRGQYQGDLLFGLRAINPL